MLGQTVVRIALVVGAAALVLLSAAYTMSIKPFSLRACFGVAGGSRYGLQVGLDHEEAIRRFAPHHARKAQEMYGFHLVIDDGKPGLDLRSGSTLGALREIGPIDQTWTIGQGRCVFHASHTDVQFRSGRISKIEAGIFYDGF